MAEAQYLTLAEVAERLHIAKTSVYNFMKTANFPTGAKFGRKCRRWNIDEIDRWAKAQSLEQEDEQ